MPESTGWTGGGGLQLGGGFEVELGHFLERLAAMHGDELAGGRLDLGIGAERQLDPEIFGQLQLQQADKILEMRKAGTI